MLKDTQRMQMVTEICSAAALYADPEARREQIIRITHKYIPRERQADDNLTQDAYHDPMQKLMRSEAYRTGCYGCALSVRDKNSRARPWYCAAEKETGQKLNYPNAKREDCKFSSLKRQQ